MVQVKTSIEAKILNEIDARRGRLSRSGFIAQIIETALFPEGKKSQLPSRYQEQSI
ncbi:hypothetical protein [Marispirochaeta aestuarii]|uniref:hypothetical protein n=1 Tax=Marispirochaeta aestuarii TaxID=1963862 RepID=UPI0029C8A4B2|nr:hypothetical protein [Marispirochaeta aestuarii]